MEDRKLNEKESLDLITSMIRNTQNKMEQNSGRLLLICGYISVVFALGIWYATMTTGDLCWNIAWFLCPLIIWPIMLRAGNKKKYVSTYIDRILKYVWMLSGVAIIIACVMSIAIKDLHSMFISALLLGLAAGITGLIVQVRIVAITGLIGMFISPVILFLQGGNQLLVFAALFVLLLIIPGHILNYKNKKLG